MKQPKDLVFEAISILGSGTSGEIAAMLPQLEKQQVYNAVNRLAELGRIERWRHDEGRRNTGEATKYRVAAHATRTSFLLTTRRWNSSLAI